MFQLEEMAAVAALFVEYNIHLMEVWDSSLSLTGAKKKKNGAEDWALHCRLQLAPQTASAKCMSLLQTASINYNRPAFSFINCEWLGCRGRIIEAHRTT